MVGRKSSPVSIDHAALTQAGPKGTVPLRVHHGAAQAPVLLTERPAVPLKT